MKKLICGILAALVVLVFAVSAFAGTVKLTFNNKTDRKVTVAIYKEVVAFEVIGWYNIEAGKSRTLSFRTEDEYPGEIGYYAEGFKKGQNTVYWSGDFARAWIHPSKAFEYRGGYNGADRDDYDNYVAGPPNKEVGFRKINIQSMQGTVNLTLK
jgi:hypothetical protein